MGKRNKFRVKIPISCCGERHYVALSKRGHLALLDHSRHSVTIPLSHWEAWADLGGKVPNCHAVLIEALDLLHRKDIPHQWTTALAPLVEPAFAKRRERIAKREQYHQQPRHLHSSAEGGR